MSIEMVFNCPLYFRGSCFFMIFKNWIRLEMICIKYCISRISMIIRLLVTTWSLSRCIEIEIYSGQIRYILDLNKNEASVYDIYVDMRNQQDVVIPEKVRYCGYDYVINKIYKSTIKKILRYLRSIELPKNILTNKFNRPALNLLLSARISEIDKKLIRSVYK